MSTNYNLLLKVLQHETLQQRINQLFNIRLSHIQRYLFTQLEISSATKVQIAYEDRELLSIKEVDEHQALQLAFSVMQVEVTPCTDQEVLDTDDLIKSIRVRYDSTDLVLEDNESTLLEQFFDHIASNDPDVVIFHNHDLNVLR